MKTNLNKIDELNYELTLGVEAADYAEIERKKLADRRRTAEFKGFRKGKVPASLIQKVYGEQCLVEAVNQVIGEGLDKEIKANELHILGEPLTSEKQPELEWKSGNDFTFIFDMAVSPKVEIEVEKSDTIPSYNVTAAAKDMKTMTENLKKYYESQKQEKSDEELEKEAAENLASQLKNESEWRLNKDIRNYFVDKAALAIPEDFLKRWLFVANDGKITKEDIEKDFAGFVEDFKWQLVRGFLMKKFNLKIDENDLREAAQGFVSYQYAMYGLSNLPKEILDEAVVNMLQDQKQVERLVEQVEDSKVIAKIKETVTLKSTKISSTKFHELDKQ